MQHSLDNMLFTIIQYLLSILLLIYFYIILLFLSHYLPQMWFLSLSLSLIYSFLKLYFRYFELMHFDGVFCELLITCTLSPSYSFCLSKFLDIWKVRIWVYIKIQFTRLCIWMCLSIIWVISIVNLWWFWLIWQFPKENKNFKELIWNLKKFSCRKKKRGKHNTITKVWEI